ncbi:uncharacterized protein [Henckelia pumila]|uniref:uncharacterized protein n=1 Tax=Henckelia pumila TaxID=405737 RepID=UPI003C6E1D84
MALHLARYLREVVVVPTEDADSQAKSAFEAWSHSDFLCWNYILNGLHNTLYSVYFATKTTKELWESLEKKYKTEDAYTKKFVVGRFLEFKMVDTKTVINQVQEFQIILHDIMTEGMVLSESFQVAALIEKLTPLWKEFKNYLKHKCKEMVLKDLIVKLEIEEDNRNLEIKNGKMPTEAKVNLVEPNCTKKRNQFGKVVFEANMVDHLREWWIETEAIRHVCADKELFSKYLYMGNNATSNVFVLGKVVLKMTSRNELTLIDVLHVSDIRKNLVSGYKLIKSGFRIVFEAGKIVIMKHRQFLGK